MMIGPVSRLGWADRWGSQSDPSGTSSIGRRKWEPKCDLDPLLNRPV